MFTGDKNCTIAIRFPDLSPAEASILAKELKQELALEGVPADQLRLERASGDAQDLGSLLLIAAGSMLGAGLIELAKVAGEEIVKGAFNRTGQKLFDAIWPILRKWGTRAKVETPSGDTVILGEEYSRRAAPRSAADAETLADLKTLGLVILGASTFPHYPANRKLDNKAFKRSAELAKKMLSPAHTVFRKVEVLDLFDQDLSPDRIVDRIEDHLEAHPDIRDVALYYCGHGAFLTDPERTYFLMLKGTRLGREAATGLSLKLFRNMIEAKGDLLRRRCTFILDCCFAGAAVDAWQLSGLDPLIENQVREVLPSRGFAFLTAADRNLPAIGKDGQGATMFTGALAEVLEGQTNGVKHLSLGDLCVALKDHIRGRHSLNAVIPQCHAPRQADGDISRIRMFLAGSSASAPRPVTASSRPATAINPPQRRSLLRRLFVSGGDGLGRTAAPPTTEVAPASPPPDAAALQIAGQEWAKLETSKDIGALNLFAKHFPGYYAELALKRIALLEKDADLAAKEAQRSREGRIKVDAQCAADPAPVTNAQHRRGPQVQYDGGGVTDLEKTFFQFWKQLKDHAQKRNVNICFQDAQPRYYLDASIRSRDAIMSFNIRRKEKVFSVELYIRDNKKLYAHLLKQKDAIERDLGEKPEWMELRGKKASRIRMSVPGVLEDESKREVLLRPTS